MTISITTLRTRDGNRCWVCGQQIGRAGHPTRDHLLPRRHGGCDCPLNIRLAHRSCNQIRDRFDSYFNAGSLADGTYPHEAVECPGREA